LEGIDGGPPDRGARLGGDPISGDMMLIRYLWNGRELQGRIEGSSAISEGEEHPLVEVELLAPSRPSKIVCVGLNYTEHARELGMEIPTEPIIFLKPPSSALSPGASIILPRESEQVDYEGEMAIVVSQRCQRVSAARADDYILGYTCFNDVTARDLQRRDGQWTRAKSFDTFAPFGPAIARIDPNDASIKTRVNGELRQSSNTSDLIFDVMQLMAFISHIMTLEAGDVIATGTPPGVGQLRAGDDVEVEIDGVGVLMNPVIPG